jgi:hypothetical protein
LRLLGALRELPVEQQVLLELHYWEGIEIGALVGLGEGGRRQGGEQCDRGESLHWFFSSLTRRAVEPYKLYSAQPPGITRRYSSDGRS